MTLQRSVQDPAKRSLTQRDSIIHNDDAQQDRTLTTCFLVVSHLLATYATNDVMAQGKADLTNLKQLEGISAVRYPEVLWVDSLRCSRIEH